MDGRSIDRDDAGGLGVSRRTYEKARAVVEAADALLASALSLLRPEPDELAN